MVCCPGHQRCGCRMKWLVVWTLVGVAAGLDKRNIIEYLADSPELSILNGLVLTAQLQEVLNSPDVTYTLLAPSDEAFNLLPADTMGQVLTDAGLLQKVLLSHVMDHPLTSLDIVHGSNDTTLGGFLVQFEILEDYAFRVSGADIVTGDIILRNGVVHVINNVLSL